ncbi:MAG: thioredoxin domain-containing protein, partial [Nannocystaceae bacterium]|nr:thioredoxin domain-containing protein [Nannocystaceae bacterium]
GDAPTLGPETAAVTVVMFSDFECPFCVQGLETLKRLRDLYPDDVRIAYKALPLDTHANALLAAMAARSAQAQGKFWEFHNLLFSGRRLDPSVILSYAKHVGLDMNTLVRDLDTLEYGPEVRRDARQARRLGISSTPTFFINGRVISGAKPLAEFDRVIGEELRYADNLRAAGVPDNQLYAETLRGGFEEVQYAKARRGLDPDAVYTVPLSDSPSKGSEDAPVTIVSFGDFACPFCAKGNATMERIEAHYGDKVRMVHKHKPLPFHRHADPAARAGVAAHNQGKFWEFHDALYAFGPKFDSSDLRTIAQEIGLDMQVYDKELSAQATADRVEVDLALSMALGVNGTPAYFINGRPMEGAYPEIHVRLLVEEELDRAQAAREQGIAPGDLYEHLTHTQLVD